jgi:hypothetical protein
MKSRRNTILNYANKQLSKKNLDPNDRAFYLAMIHSGQIVLWGEGTIQLMNDSIATATIFLSSALVKQIGIDRLSLDNGISNSYWKNLSSNAKCSLLGERKILVFGFKSQYSNFEVFHLQPLVQP